MTLFAAIILACLGATSAMPQNMGFNTGTPTATGGMQQNMGFNAGAPAATGGMAGAGPAWGNTRNWGPQAYGPGLNNPWAVPVNAWQMQSMIKIAEGNPNLLVRADIDGELQFTDRYGMEVDSPFEQVEDMFEF